MVQVKARFFISFQPDIYDGCNNDLLQKVLTNVANVAICKRMNIQDFFRV